ncbi:PREDICTED: lipase ZK262.3-like isoform X2 [Ipomoea nil]|uniref:lipase ZK262.3-like isoform X2 n=1 Tax=Ipomoea nil TaxID=35883 RepID=UPI000900B859|nr:PREDICTED: lipase ZK262.3-like isoform X2 [Ipomoea nil]
MDWKNLLKVVILMCLFSLSPGRELNVRAKLKSDLAVYNHTLATILVEYAAAVYMTDTFELFTWTCSICDDLTRGFEMIELIVDVQYCLQAFVGVDPNIKAIVVAFRGSTTSIMNWVEDLYWKQLDFDYPGMDGAMVTTLPYQVPCTFCWFLDKLPYTNIQVNFGAEEIQVMTFGQPRMGNAAFATGYSERVPNTIRVTHGHDIVPHLPPYFSLFPSKTYHHFPREVWLYNIGLGSLVYTVEKVCDGSGEDPTCSRSVTGNSISDHLTYYGIRLGNEESVSCSIVLDPRVSSYATQYVNGNVILSRDLYASVLRINSDHTDQIKPL